MRKFLFITLALLSLNVTAQINFGKAELDANYLKSKQYKRVQDYSDARKSGKWSAVSALITPTTRTFG